MSECAAASQWVPGELHPRCGPMAACPKDLLSPLALQGGDAAAAITHGRAAHPRKNYSELPSL